MISVVTGGAGFIGSWLCESLLEKGHRVVCVDNLVTGREENVEHLKADKSFRFMRQDVSEGLDVRGDVDHVFHLASPASPVDFERIPIRILKTNSIGTLNALELARSMKAVFLLAGTSEVYGDPKVHPQTEDYWGNVNPIGPRSCYDESKRFAEALTMSFVREYGIDARIVRIFNTYGPRMRKDDGRVMPNFINQALRGEPITVHGDGSQTRSFCYVTDLVRGLEAVMFSKGLSGEVFNLGNPDECTIAELAESIKKLLGSESEVVFRDLPADDPARRRPDISKIGKSVGWIPSVSLDDGLRKTAEYFSGS
jgi:nucleoside-diphosphate-sugar epimerase